VDPAAYHGKRERNRIVHKEILTAVTHPGHFGQDQRRERHLRSFNDASANGFVPYYSGSEVAVRCHVYLFGCCYLYWAGAISAIHYSPEALKSTFNHEDTSNRCHSSGQPRVDVKQFKEPR
jgi:hypothetical protein